MRALLCRRIAGGALAVLFGVAGLFVADAGAAPADRANDRAQADRHRGQSETAPGQLRKLEAEPGDHALQGQQPAAAERVEGDSPGGQGCDGSHGSDTGTGANTDGPGNSYHNTCDGSPSENGAGDGTAAGKPCAGCVGNADDKNPPGQYKDGGDANGGYECDERGAPAGGNSGVGVGNPAHTGCAPKPDAETQPCPDGKMPADDGSCSRDPQRCPDGTEMPPSGDCVPNPCPAGEAVCGTVRSCPIDTPLPPGAACETDSPPLTRPTAADGPPAPNGGAPTVLGTTLGRPAEVLGERLTRAPVAAVSPAELGRTGFEPWAAAQPAAGLLIAGAALVAASRRRDSRA